MKKSIAFILTAGTLAAVLTTAPFYAQETEDVLPEVLTEVSSDVSELDTDSQSEPQGTKINTSIENGVLTITIDDPREDNGNLYWTYYTDDKGDASLVELLTQSTDDGVAYAGSFRAIDDGTDTIRIARTNGTYVLEYEDFEVLCENGEIKEITGGGQAFGVDPEELIEVIGGIWNEKDGGSSVMEFTLGTDGGIDVVVSDGSGKDGVTEFYTMTVYYDAIRDALFYNNGTSHTAAITDGSEEDTEAAAPADDSEESADAGFGALRLESETDEEDDLIIYWDDLSSNADTVAFVR